MGVPRTLLLINRVFKHNYKHDSISMSQLQWNKVYIIHNRKLNPISYPCIRYLWFNSDSLIICNKFAWGVNFLFTSRWSFIQIGLYTYIVRFLYAVDGSFLMELTFHQSILSLATFKITMPLVSFLFILARNPQIRGGIHSLENFPLYSL